MCSGEMLNAKEAADLGIISHVTEPGDEVKKAIEIIEKMTRYAPQSVRKILEATLLNQTKPEDGFGYERKAFAELLQTENAKEGMTAFMEKRKPEFK
jgi:enoyl-CoA hydratase/carnithine racemase